MKSKPEVDAAISRIIERHMRLDKADDLFSELSKVGGNAFRTAMTRVKRIIQKQRAAEYQVKLPDSVEPVGFYNQHCPAR